MTTRSHTHIHISSVPRKTKEKIDQIRRNSSSRSGPTCTCPGKSLFLGYIPSGYRLHLWTAGSFLSSETWIKSISALPYQFFTSDIINHTLSLKTSVPSYLNIALLAKWLMACRNFDGGTVPAARCFMPHPGPPSQFWTPLRTDML